VVRFYTYINRSLEYRRMSSVWNFVQSAVGGASTKFFKWKELISNIQLLKQSKDVQASCAFQSLLNEWDKQIKTKEYANLKINGEYVCVRIKEIGSRTYVIGREQQRKEGTDFLGYVPEYYWIDVKEVNLKVDEQQLYRGIFAPEYSPCEEVVEFIPPKDSDERRTIIESDWANIPIAFVNSIFSFAEYLYDRIEFQMKIHMLGNTIKKGKHPEVKF